jgi:hypothetical protein
MALELTGFRRGSRGWVGLWAAMVRKSIKIEAEGDTRGSGLLLEIRDWLTCVELILLRGKKKPAWRNQTPSGLFIPPNNVNTLPALKKGCNEGWPERLYQGKTDCH